jgi:hypothetical protein
MGHQGPGCLCHTRPHFSFPGLAPSTTTRKSNYQHMTDEVSSKKEWVAGSDPGLPSNGTRKHRRSMEGADRHGWAMDDHLDGSRAACYNSCQAGSPIRHNDTHLPVPPITPVTLSGPPQSPQSPPKPTMPRQRNVICGADSFRSTLYNVASGAETAPVRSNVGLGDGLCTHTA